MEKVSMRHGRAMRDSAFTCLAALACLQMRSHAAHAQTAPNAGSIKVEDVIVTAQRRSASLSKTPVAVVLLSGKSLAQQAIRSQQDLQAAMPGLIVKSNSSTDDLNFVIRGQSLDVYSYARPGVLPYFDEIEIGGQGTASSFYDLQSVQALKGPQGTLFGRNSTGGAVLFTTTPPASRLGGYIESSIGNYGSETIDGAMNVPIIPEKLLLRVAGIFTTNTGYQHNLYDGTELGGAHREGGRISLTANPTNYLTDTFVADIYHASGTNMSPVLGSLQSDALVPVVSLYSPGPLLSAYIARLADPSSVPAGGLPEVLAQQQARGPFITDTNAGAAFRTNNVILVNSTTATLESDAKLKNILGYSHVESFSNVDSDGSPFDVTDTTRNPTIGDTENATQISEELQLSGKTLGGKLDYVSGFFFSYEKTYQDAADGVLDIFTDTPSAINSFPYNRMNTTYAGYGQGTYDLGQITSIPGLAFTAGARYSAETVEVDVLPGNVAYSIPEAIATHPGTVAADYADDQSRTFYNTSFTFGLKDQIDSHLLVYVTGRQSYKNGGFNGGETPLIGNAQTVIGGHAYGGNAYGTETVADVELGAKFNGVLGGVPLSADLALFHDFITDSQRTAYVLSNGDVPSVTTVNVPKAEAQGVEIDLQARPLSWLRVGGAINYLDAHFTQGLTAVDGTTALFDGYSDAPK